MDPITATLNIISGITDLVKVVIASQTPDQQKFFGIGILS